MIVAYMIGCYLAGALATASIIWDVPSSMRLPGWLSAIVVVTWPLPIVAAVLVLVDARRRNVGPRR